MPRRSTSIGAPCAVAALLVGAVLPGLGRSQSWQEGPAFPDASAGRVHTRALAVGDQVLALGGRPFTANLDSPVHFLQVGGNSWGTGEILEGTTIHHGVGLDGLGRIVVFGGRAEVGDDQGKSYDYTLVDGKVDEIANRGGAAPIERFAFATDSQGRLYSLGGGPGEAASSGDRNSAYVERYDAPTNTWTPLAPLPVACADAAATYLPDANGGGGRIVVIGGFDALATTRLSTVQVYEVDANTWSTSVFPDLPVGLVRHAAATGANGWIYVVGGDDGTGPLASTYVLDVPAGVWRTGPALAVPRRDLGLTLGVDEHLYALGGDDGSGGTHRVEFLFTPPCPAFTQMPVSTQAMTGTTAMLEAAVEGGEPLEYEWRLDGVAVADGWHSDGTVIEGATTPRLLLREVTPRFAGRYTLHVRNPCGRATSDAARLQVLTPPDLSGPWLAMSMHPAGALHSNLRGIDGHELVGSATFPDSTYGSLEHPYLWNLDQGTALDLTPPNSVGGALRATANGLQVGWYWWPYSTKYGTAYNRHACAWQGTAGSAVDVQPSGWEYGSIVGTDGVQLIGGITFDDTSTTSDGALWNSLVKSATRLTPPSAWGSSGAAVENGRQYGSVNLGFGVVHAARWVGTADSFLDLDPAGSSWSYVLGCGDGQQVGRATFSGEHHAALWQDSADTFLDLHPRTALASEAYAASKGLQVGAVQGSRGIHATIWASRANDRADLHRALETRFSASYAYCVLVLEDEGTVLVGGMAYDPALVRWEAMLWTLPIVHSDGDDGEPGRRPSLR